MEIISIDLHARKNSNVFDGSTLYSFSAEALRRYVDQLKTSKEEVILLLNAPLTGYIQEFEKLSTFSPAVTRGIEYFFNRKEYGYSMTKLAGIRISNYASLGYWPLIQSLFHLNLSKSTHGKKFVPVFAKDQVSNKQINLIETHSNVALWLLWNEKSAWRLADKKTDFEKFRDDFCRSVSLPVRETVMEQLRTTTNANAFDAVFGHILGYLWVTQGGDYAVLGNQYTGAFVLPFSDNLLSSFKYFTQRTIFAKLYGLKKPGKLIRDILSTNVYDHCRELEKPKGSEPKASPFSATNHAYERARERLTWKKHTVDRMLEKVVTTGLSEKQVTGKLLVFMKSKRDRNEPSASNRIFGQHLFIFYDKTLVTIFRVPNRYLGESGKQAVLA